MNAIEFISVSKKTEDKLIKVLLIIIAFIVFLNIINVVFNKPSWQLDRFINMDREANFPAWFSGMILAIAGFFAYRCSIAANVRERGSKMFQFLALGLLGMSCDEVAMIHEHLGMFVDRHFLNSKGAGISWVISLGPIVLLIIAIFVIKLKSCLIGSNKAKKFLIIGAFIYIFGAFGLETLLSFPKTEILNRFLNFEFIIEEFFEMTGTVLVIKGLMEHFKFLTS